MAYRWLRVLLVLAVAVAGCASDESNGPFTGDGGTGGDGGAGGTAGTGGPGGGGTGGTPLPSCVTSLLCRACPSETSSCDTDDDCSVGSVCIESGCSSELDGTPIKQCVFAGGSACNDSFPCLEGRQCLEVPEEGNRCVKTTPGCDTSFDCVFGFTCENGTCVDRRVPCNLDEDCPKNHVCSGTINSTFCIRIHTDCASEIDCSDRAPRCEDVDGDGNKECAGTLELSPFSDTCLNATCTDASAPVCEAGGVGSTSVCGQHGLCQEDADCAAGFRCAPLWPDGRKECVPSESSCSSFADCGVREVCASPRTGGPASCQSGAEE